MDEKITVDKASVDYQFGAIITRLDGLSKLPDAINNLTQTIAALPCSDHNLRIKTLETKGTNCNNSNQWALRNSVTFRQDIFRVAIGAGIGSGATAIIMSLV